MVETTESRDAEVARIAAALRTTRLPAISAKADDRYWATLSDDEIASDLYDAGLRSTSRDSEPETIRVWDQGYAEGFRAGQADSTSRDSEVHDDPDWPHVPDHSDIAARFGARAGESRDSEDGTCGYECPYNEEAHRDWQTFDGQTDHAFEPRSTSRDSEVREAIEALRSLSDAATVGPWQWDGQVGQYVNLATVGHGVLTVMGTKRLGMNGSEPVFYRRDPGEVWGWNGKAEPASKVAVREVPYRDDIADIDNPNAQLIVAAVNAVRKALAILDRSSEAAPTGYGGITNYPTPGDDEHYPASEAAPVVGLSEAVDAVANELNFLDVALDAAHPEGHDCDVCRAADRVAQAWNALVARLTQTQKGAS